MRQWLIDRYYHSSWEWLQPILELMCKLNIIYWHGEVGYYVSTGRE